MVSSDVPYLSVQFPAWLAPLALRLPLVSYFGGTRRTHNLHMTICLGRFLRQHSRRLVHRRLRHRRSLIRPNPSHHHPPPRSPHKKLTVLSAARLSIRRAPVSRGPT